MPSLLPLVCLIAGAVVVQTWHEYYRWYGVLSFLQFLGKAFARGGVVVVRPRYREMMAPSFRWGLKNKRLCFIPNASSIPPVVLDEAQRRAVRGRFLSDDSRLIVYFGFIYPSKRAELLFEIADPARDFIVLIGEIDAAGSDAYQRKLRHAASQPQWQNRVAFTGYLPAEEVAVVLAAADAVVLPFADGGGEWNTSIHGAQAQGTFVLTTSREVRGYQPELNTFLAEPDNVEEMRDALRRYAGKRRDTGQRPRSQSWRDICLAHLDLYRAVGACGATGR